jgi:hypothetical protein
MDDEIDAFVAAWMRDNCHVLEEIVHMQGDDPSTPFGAALAACLQNLPPWTLASHER